MRGGTAQAPVTPRWGQLDPEADTAARAAFHADGAAMRFDDRAHDGEAQAGSPRLPVVGHAYAMSETLWM